MRLLPLVLTACALAALPLRAQPATAYADSALGIAPTWNGLAVTRGALGRHVANLGFFLPTDVRRAFAGDAADAAARDAARQAYRAVRLRRAALLFTDAGLALGAVAVARRDRGLAVGAGAALGLGVPLQFAADGALSRAVWLFNERFAR